MQRLCLALFSCFQWVFQLIGKSWAFIHFGYLPNKNHQSPTKLRKKMPIYLFFRDFPHRWTPPPCRGGSPTLLGNLEFRLSTSRSACNPIFGLDFGCTNFFHFVDFLLFGAFHFVDGLSIFFIGLRSDFPTSGACSSGLRGNTLVMEQIH